MDLKPLLYDWMGGNVKLFQEINAIQSPWYDYAMRVLSIIGDHRHFIYYYGALIAYVLIKSISRKLGGRAGTRHYLAVWIGVLLVLGIGYALNGYVVTEMKSHFQYPRPYAVLENVNVSGTPAGDISHSSRSFPSGHATFTTLMIIGLWPVLNGFGRWFGLALIGGVAWSRIAMGQHFPADVIYGFLLTTCLIVLLRWTLYAILLKVFRLKC